MQLTLIYHFPYLVVFFALIFTAYQRLFLFLCDSVWNCWLICSMLKRATNKMCLVNMICVLIVVFVLLTRPVYCCQMILCVYLLIYNSFLKCQIKLADDSIIMIVRRSWNTEIIIQKWFINKKRSLNCRIKWQFDLKMTFEIARYMINRKLWMKYTPSYIIQVAGFFRAYWQHWFAL